MSFNDLRRANLELNVEFLCLKNVVGKNLTILPVHIPAHISACIDIYTQIDPLLRLGPRDKLASGLAPRGYYVRIKNGEN